MNTYNTILIIEDDLLLNQLITTFLKRNYEKVESFSDAELGIKRLHEIQPDLLLLNLLLGPHNGIDILEKLRTNG